MSPEDAWAHILLKYNTYQNPYWSHVDPSRWVGNDKKLHEMYATKALTANEISKYKTHFLENVYPKSFKDLENKTKELQKRAPAVFNDIDKKLAGVMKKIGITIPRNILIETTIGSTGGTFDKGNCIALRITLDFERDVSLNLPHEFIHMIVEKRVNEILAKNRISNKAVIFAVHEMFVEFFQTEFLKMNYGHGDFWPKYLTIESVQNDLDNTMSRMITDYKKMMQKSQIGNKAVAKNKQPKIK